MLSGWHDPLESSIRAFGLVAHTDTLPGFRVGVDHQEVLLVEIHLGHDLLELLLVVLHSTRSRSGHIVQPGNKDAMASVHFGRVSPL